MGSECTNRGQHTIFNCLDDLLNVHLVYLAFFSILDTDSIAVRERKVNSSRAVFALFRWGLRAPYHGFIAKLFKQLAQREGQYSGGNANEPAVFPSKKYANENRQSGGAGTGAAPRYWSGKERIAPQTLHHIHATRIKSKKYSVI